MSEINITQLMKRIHEEEINKTIIAEVHEELNQGVPDELLLEVQALVDKVNAAKPTKVVSFPTKKVRLGSMPRIAAAGQDLGSWIARPLVYSESGMEIDIRKILGSEDKVNVYVHSTGNDFSKIEKNLMPFKGKILQVRLSIDGKELLKAEIYVDETGHNAEGTGHLKAIDESEVHGNIDLDIILEE